LVKWFNVRAIDVSNIVPRLEERQLFLEAVDQNQDGEDSDTHAVFPTMQAFRSFVKSDSQVELDIGDQIYIYKGDLVSVIGKVKSFEANGVRVVFAPTNLDGVDMDLVVDVEHCHKYFNLGDPVTIVEGKYTGESAMIMSLDEKEVDKPLCKIESNQIEIRINTKCLKRRDLGVNQGQGIKSNNRSTYKVGDLITYDDSKVYGHVVKVEPDFI
jgi:transcription antitermination factor NusG